MAGETGQGVEQGLAGANGSQQRRLTARPPQPLHVRAQADFVLEVSASAATATEGALRLAFDQAYFGALRIKEIQPEPESQTLAGDLIVYAFAAEGGDQIQVRFRIEPKRPGVLEGAVGVKGGRNSPSVTWSFPSRGRARWNLCCVALSSMLFFCLSSG